MKSKYDFVMGLGAACSCSQSLRAAGLQLLSLPYDWTAPSDPSDLPVRVRHTVSHFKDWLNRDDLVRGEEISEKGNVMYRNMRTRHVFPHDFLASDDFDDAYPRVAEKYARRIRRLYDCIGRSRHVLLVRIETPIQPVPTTLAECKAALKDLSEHFGGVSFDLCLLQLERGRSLADRIERQIGDNILQIVFDYKSTNPADPPYACDIGTIGALLKSRFSVRDYRTRAERKAEKLRRQQAKWRANGARSAIEYRLIKIRKRLAALFGSATGGPVTKP